MPLLKRPLRSDPDALRRRLAPGPAGLNAASLECAFREAPGYWPSGGIDSPAFRARVPGPAETVPMAERAAAGRIRFWQPWHMEKTQVEQALGARVDWKRAPSGDPEWAHALARFTHMLDLAAASRMDGRPVFLEAWGRYLESYLSARDPEDGFWQNRLDSSLRLLNLVRSYDLLKADPALTPALRAAALTAMLAEGDWLAGQLGRHVNNWEFFITCSLAAASEYLSGLFEVESWGEAARARLAEVLASEVRADGTFSEQAPMYQGEVALALLDYLLVLGTRGKTPPPGTVAAASALSASLAALADPEGMIPPLGDSDRFPAAYISGFAAAVLAPWKASGPSPAAALGGAATSGVPAAPGIPAEAAATGIPAAASGGFATGAAPFPGAPGPGLTHYPDAGLAAYRWPRSGGGIGYLLLDASGKPPARRRYHSHADDLGFILHTSSGPLLTDPGRFTYASSHPGILPILGRPAPFYPRGRLRPAHDLLFPSLRELNRRDWRAWFRGSLAHNTVSCEGRDHPGYESDALDGRPSRLRNPAALGPMALLGGEMAPDAGGGFAHLRLVAGVLPELWVIVDKAEGREPCDWTVSHHFGHGVEATAGDGPLSLFLDGGGVGPGRRARMEWALAVGSKAALEVEDDWVSPEYNLKLPSRTARIRVVRSAGFSLATLILPEEAGIGATLEWLPQGVVLARSVAVDGELKVWVNPTGAPFSSEGVESDAALAFLRFRGGFPVEAGFLDGTRLRAMGHEFAGEGRRFHGAVPGRSGAA